MRPREVLWPPRLLGELPSRDAVRHPRYDVLAAAIDALPAERRDLMNALFWETLTERQAGERVGKSRAWAAMQKRLALAFVQGFIIGRECDDQ